MDYLLHKSEQNLKISFFLFQDAPEKCFPASIHCSYYSCLQKIIHIFDYYYDKPYKKISNEVKGKKTGSHSHYINEIRDVIRPMDRTDARNLSNNLKELRALRISADYSNEIITEELAQNAYDYAIKIHKVLKKHLSL